MGMRKPVDVGTGSLGWGSVVELGRLGRLGRSEDPPCSPPPPAMLRSPEPKRLAWGCLSWSDRAVGENALAVDTGQVGAFREGGRLLVMPTGRARIPVTVGTGSPLKGEKGLMGKAGVRQGLLGQKAPW